MSPISGNSKHTGFLTATDPARLFIIGGMILIIAGLIFGDIFAIFIVHPNAGRIGQEFAAAVAATAAGDPDKVFSHFGVVGSLLENAGTKKDSHVHIIHVGYLAFVLAFMQPWVALSQKRKIQLAKTFLWAAVLLPVAIFLIHYVGLLYSPLETIGWASIIADISGLVLTLVLVIELAGLWRYLRGNGDENARCLPSGGRNSRTLLIGGSMLVLAGFLFGAYYAGIHAAEHEQRELSILGNLLTQASARQTEMVNQGLADYGGLQVERGVMIAAHAHVIEFGLLALMLAIAQPFVFLSQKWRRRLVWMMLGGGIVLPIAVFAEIWYGLLAGAVADFAGLMVILALFGMFIGVLRETGKADTEGSGAA